MAANGCCRCRGSWRSSFDRSRIGSGKSSRSRPQPRLSRLRTRSMLRRSKGQGWVGKVRHTSWSSIIHPAFFVWSPIPSVLVPHLFFSQPFPTSLCFGTNECASAEYFFNPFLFMSRTWTMTLSILALVSGDLRQSWFDFIISRTKISSLIDARDMVISGRANSICSFSPDQFICKTGPRSQFSFNQSHPFTVGFHISLQP